MDIVYGTSDGRIGYSLNNGSQVFGIQQELTADGAPLDVGNRAVFELYDWNNDGNADIISGSLDGGFQVYLNDGQWNFTRGADLNISVAAGRSTAALGDFNNDGLVDLVSGDTDGGIYLFLNNGNGEFSQITIEESSGISRSRIAAGDVNNDGVVDLVAGYADGSIRVISGRVMLSYGYGFTLEISSLSPELTGGLQIVQQGDDVIFQWQAAVNPESAKELYYVLTVNGREYLSESATLTISDLQPGTYSCILTAYNEYGGFSIPAEKIIVSDLTQPLPYAAVGISPASR